MSQSFADALANHQLQLTESQAEHIQQYCHLLWDWNERLNLTRHLDYETFVARDVLDSVRLVEVLDSGETVLDVGAGGGVPGIIVAILRPDVQVTLCDSIEKKTKALRDMVTKLELPTEVVNARIQDHLARHRYDALCARAVGAMAKMLRWVEPHWDQFERMLLIKGPRWVEERSDARHRGLMHGIELRKLCSYPMPGTESESVILSLRRGPDGDQE